MSRAKKMLDAVLKPTGSELRNKDVQRNNESNLNLHATSSVLANHGSFQFKEPCGNLFFMETHPSYAPSPVSPEIMQRKRLETINPPEDNSLLDTYEKSYSILENVTFNLNDAYETAPPTAEHSHNSDIIEPSEQDDMFVLPSELRSCITQNHCIIDNHTDNCLLEDPFLNNESRESSDSDEQYIPSPCISSSSSDLGDITTQLDLTQAVTLSDTVTITNEDAPISQSSSSGLQQNNRKQKVFQPKEHYSKKRRKNEKEWKQKRTALARERGEEYISQKTDTVIPKKKIKEGLLCHEKCRLSCSEKFSIDQRKRILENYYCLDVNGKNALLFQSLICMPVARQRKGAIKHKSSSYKYYVTRDGVTEEVCKPGLCALYQIGRKKIDIIRDQIKTGASAPAPDRRGRHLNRPHKMGSEVRDRIKNHISSFPTEQSHYSRHNNSHKKYLSPLLNVTKMYNLFIEMCNTEGLPHTFKIKKATYHNVFVTEFNLSFGYPRSDTCAICDAGESSEEHKENHHAAVEAMRADRNMAKNNENVTYVTIDLQQTMPLPKIPTSKAFYLRQIWFYNFGIHVFNKNKEKAFFCTWTEDVADRGSCEIASALLRFVETECNGPQKTDNLVIWSDSCAGQNKNFNMICLYQYIIYKGYFKTIDHKFPQVGHSYLDSDRDFGRIEKVLRKHETVFIPEQYRDIICKSSRLNQVVNMFGHFREISSLQDKLKLINRKVDVNKSKVNFRDGIRWIRVEEFGSYLYKETYDNMTPFKKVDIMKKNCRPGEFVLQRVTDKYGTISQEKKENIRDQLKFVKPEYRYFYEEILQN